MDDNSHTQPEHKQASPAHIVDYRSEYWSDVQTLYETYFGPWSARRFAERWRWQFQDNPFTRDRASRLRVATAAGRVIGHIAGFPVPLWLEGHRHICLSGCDMVVSKQYRSLALMLLKDRMDWRPIMDTGFTPTLEKLFKLLRMQMVPLSQRRLVYSLRYTGAMQRALRRRLPGSLRPLASRALASCLGLFLKPSWALAKKVPPAEPATDGLKELQHFGEEYDRFWSRLRNEFVWSVDRDARYMNWRYKEGPFRSIRAWKHTDSEGHIAGVLVTGVRVELDQERLPRGTSGEILELLAPPDDDTLVSALAAHAVRELNSRGVDSVSALGLTPRYHSALCRLGFEIVDHPRFTMSFDTGLPAHERSALSEDLNCYISSGDGDQTFGLVL